MTIVAWDGKMLAADKQAVVASQKYPVTKVYRVDADRLAGISGHLGRGTTIVAWLRGGAVLDQFPKSNADYDYTQVMVVSRAGDILVYENGAYPFTVNREQHCIGSGRDFGLSALFLGLNAESAVVHASNYSADCGLGVDTLTFDAE